MEMPAGYLISPSCEDIYVYLVQNKLPYHKAAIKKVKHWQKYICYYLYYCFEIFSRTEQILVRTQAFTSLQTWLPQV